MKRFICLILAAAMLFSLGACSVKNDIEGDAVTTTAPAPKLKETKQSKKFKDENGRVVFTVDVVLPEISKNAEKHIIEYVNDVINEVFEDACENAQANIQNAANAMDNLGLDTPWSTKITFEETYMSGRYVCFLIENAFSMTGKEAEPSYSTKCFDIVNGMECDAMYFAAEGMADYKVKYAVLDLIQEKARSDFYAGGFKLTDEQVELIKNAFTLDSFYLTQNGFGFYFDKYIVDDSIYGTYRTEFTFAQLEGILVSPESVQ